MTSPKEIFYLILKQNAEMKKSKQEQKNKHVFGFMEEDYFGCYYWRMKLVSVSLTQLFWNGFLETMVVERKTKNCNEKRRPKINACCFTFFSKHAICFLRVSTHK